ncbi:MAG: sigma-70 family RNA polymerase sigma factor [Clostridia bacterium]|nr:sigma-70 family RNA polymerase sigma factor [Clostridia bacterium]
MTGSALRTDGDFENFYGRNCRFVYRLCLSYMKNGADAEDVAQDVFVKALKEGMKFENSAHERRWLSVVSVNMCKNALKSWKRKKVDSISEVPEPQTAENDYYGDVLEAVSRLPAKHKDAVWLFYYDGYSTAEIAQILGKPPSTVRGIIRDARKKLRKILGDEYFE